MLQATITVQFGINCTATSSNSGLIALLRVVIITHYNACYVIIYEIKSLQNFTLQHIYYNEISSMYLLIVTVYDKISAFAIWLNM